MTEAESYRQQVGLIVRGIGQFQAPTYTRQTNTKCMLRVGFESTTPVFGRSKTVRNSDPARAAYCSCGSIGLKYVGSLMPRVTNAAL
jgi:hypothetical protein